jgi:hypothetical protein
MNLTIVLLPVCCCVLNKLLTVANRRNTLGYAAIGGSGGGVSTALTADEFLGNTNSKGLTADACVIFSNTRLLFFPCGIGNKNTLVMALLLSG